MGFLCTHPPPGSVVPGTLKVRPQPGQEGGTGSVIGSPFVDLEGSVDS